MRALSALLGVTALLTACDADSGDAAADAATDAEPDVATTGDAGPAEDVPPLDGMPPPPDLRMNHVRVRGTHNSYHLKPDNILPDWQYEHLPLDQQLETQHVRQFELDVHFKADGFHVYHLPGVDAGSTCDRFVDCLGVLRTWSERHPGHVPIIVLVEPKDDVDSNKIKDHLPELEAEILSAVPRDWLITPDDVRGDAPDVRTAVTTVGWPRLEAARGRTLFVLLDHAETRDALLALHPKTEGSVFFASGDEAEPSSAFLLLDDATGEEARIDAAVRAGYMVRTMAGDAPEIEAALRGGAHTISTDFPMDVPMENDGGPECNPVTAPVDCLGPMEPRLSPP